MLREKMANFRRKKINCRAVKTKKWIKSVTKLRKQNPLKRGVARNPLLWVLDTEKPIERKTSVCEHC